MNTRHFVLALLSALCTFGQESPATLQVSGAVKQPLTLTAEDLAGMPRASLQTKSDGIAVTYEGVWLHEVLKRAGAPNGTELRGKALASYVLAEAKDGSLILLCRVGVKPALQAPRARIACAWTRRQSRASPPTTTAPDQTLLTTSSFRRRDARGGTGIRCPLASAARSASPCDRPRAAGSIAPLDPCPAGPKRLRRDAKPEPRCRREIVQAKLLGELGQFGW